MTLSMNSKTMAALTFCLVTAAIQILARCKRKMSGYQEEDWVKKGAVHLGSDIADQWFQSFCTFMWKNEVRAMLVTGERTCCLAWITLTRNASTALRPISSRYTREMRTSPLWLYTKRPPIILNAYLLHQLWTENLMYEFQSKRHTSGGFGVPENYFSLTFPSCDDSDGRIGIWNYSQNMADEDDIYRRFVTLSAAASCGKIWKLWPTYKRGK